MQRTVYLVLAASLAGCMGKAEAPVEESKPQEAAKAAAEPAGDEGHAEHGEHGEHGEHAAAADPSCPHGGVHAEGCDGAAAPADATKSHFGAEFTVDGAVELAKAMTTPDAEKVVRVSGTVDSVCQKMGCWMVLADGDKTARILMKDHAFAVPMDCKGRKAEVEGTLTAKTFTEAQAKHLEEDGGGDPGKVEGEKKEYVISATGVRLLDS